jgi:hypothetical protein
MADAPFNYEKMVAMADKLLTKFGEPITVKRPVDSVSAAPSAAWRPGAPTYTSFATSGVFLPNGIRGPFTLARKKGEDVAHGDIICYIPGDVFGPTDFTTRMELTDIVVRADGTQFRLSACDFLWPGGPRPTFYEARVQR